MAKEHTVLFPYNGHLFTLDKFAEELERLIEAAKVYDTGVARPVDRKLRKELFKQLSDHFKHKSE